MGLSDMVFGATNVSVGLDADKPSNPKAGQVYLASDSKKTYSCYDDGTWTDVVGTNTVATAAIQDLAVTEGKIASGAVTSAKLGAGVVTETKIASGAVTSAKIANGSVTESKLSCLIKFFPQNIVNYSDVEKSYVSNFSAGTDVFFNSPTERTTTSSSLVLLKRIVINKRPNATLIIAADIEGNYDYCEFSFRKNEVQFYTEQYAGGSKTVYNTVAVADGDVITVYGRRMFSGATAKVKNLSIRCTKQPVISSDPSY